MGDRRTNLKAAVDELAKLSPKPLEFSSVYATDPWGKTDQPQFLNLVVSGLCFFEPFDLLDETQKIEKTLGRARKEHWGERIIDIDILIMGDRTVNEPALVIPHKEMVHRRFALVPMAEIAPDLKHPLLNKSMHELLEDCQDPLSVIQEGGLYG